MRKRQLASQISKRFENEYGCVISSTDVYNLLTVLSSVVIERVAIGEEVRIAGLCKFVLFKWNGRLVRHLSGEEKQVGTQYAIRARIFGGANQRMRLERKRAKRSRLVKERLESI